MGISFSFSESNQPARFSCKKNADYKYFFRGKAPSRKIAVFQSGGNPQKGGDRKSKTRRSAKGEYHNLLK
jgi:hypothetical protein